VEHCVRQGIPNLTLFAFSSENWSRPVEEVDLLMTLFLRALRNEVKDLIKYGVRLRFAGDLSRLSPTLQEAVASAVAETSQGEKLNLNIAVNYGGRWDIVHAARQLAEQVQRGEIEPDAIDSDLFQRHVSLGDLPEPDLFIRTGGETRISNFLLWQAAYAEFVFSPVLWPDFDETAFENAVKDFSDRQRRFGLTGEQVS